MNAFDLMRAAVAEARATVNAADSVADGMASLLRGRLRHVRPSVLVELKRELHHFDAQKKTWKP